ncbi:hypothetical protein RHSIM_Rhsim01G0213600 [Rhododendron simsii]|uniref:Uncharacterized protein n=1 Tax=Rhododendron simsii TaxID=118357 RepID=A0A834HFY7_RHOSS|nr:hypothetical protein RHSIM_Rhsim01G0213600 [Rhododendron simsii]
MLRPVRPSLNFWYYLGIISSPAWVFSFLAMDFVKKRTSLVAVLLILTIVISGIMSNFVLSKLYFWLRRNPENERFFYGYERAGKTTGYVLVFFGNIGLFCYSEKSVACMLTSLFLAVYCLSTLLCIQPYTDFGVLEFLLSSSMNQALSLLGICSYWSWLVIIACIGIGAMRYCLEPVHPRGEGTRDEVQVIPTSMQPPATYETVDLSLDSTIWKYSRDKNYARIHWKVQTPIRDHTKNSNIIDRNFDRSTQRTQLIMGI